MAAKPSPDYDIFPRLAAFLDTHLTFPVLSFVESLEVGRYRLQVARKGIQHPAHASPMAGCWRRCPAFRSLQDLTEISSTSHALQIYDPKDVATSRLELAKRTKMSDYIIDCYKEVHGADAAIPKGAVGLPGGSPNKLEAAPSLRGPVIVGGFVLCVLCVQSSRT